MAKEQRDSLNGWQARAAAGGVTRLREEIAVDQDSASEIHLTRTSQGSGGVGARGSEIIVKWRAQLGWQARGSVWDSSCCLDLGAAPLE